MKRIAVFIAVFLLSAGPVCADTSYLRTMPDIPLMEGMKEIADSDVVFDKAEGRIVEESVSARNLSPKQINDFYNQTLPALGWMPKSPQRFFRNGEQLVVNLDKLQSEGLVRFAVSPIQP